MIPKCIALAGDIICFLSQTVHLLMLLLPVWVGWVTEKPGFEEELSLFDNNNDEYGYELDCVCLKLILLLLKDISSYVDLPVAPVSLSEYADQLVWA